MSLQKRVFYLKFALILSVIFSTIVIMFFEYKSFHGNLNKLSSTHHKHIDMMVDGYFEYFKDEKELNSFLDNLKKHYNFNLLIVEDSKDEKYKVKYSSSKQFLKYLPNISSNSELIDNRYSVNIYKLNTPKHNLKVISFYNTSTLISELEVTLYKLFVILFLCSIVIIFFLNMVLNYFVKTIILREKEAEQKATELYFNSRHNELTKLPNINVMSEAVLMHEDYSVLMLNIDNISILNTTYGTKTVDCIFKEVAKYIELNLPSNGLVYHMSADEFAIILDNPKENQELLLSSQIKAYFEHTPIDVTDYKVHIQFSIGIGKHKQDDHNKLNVFTQANIALVEAKHRAKGLILVYSDDMSSFGSYTQLAKNISILQKDLENESLTPFYQPIVDTYTKEIVKYEVLARIKDEKGFISPHMFMEAAEVAGLQTAITKQIIQKSFKYFENTDIAFCINITKHDFLAKYLQVFLERKTKQHNIKPQNVTLEILEDIAIENNDEMIQQINHLSSLGYVIAIDDFGVESSNISKLSDLDANFIKIDGSFIKDMDTNPKHLGIVESLVFMAKKLDMQIIAEYVHSEAIYNIVKDLGIDYSQGYYFSEPKEKI